MSATMIEKELASLKKRVKQLEAKVESKPRHAWRETIGFAKNDPLFDEALRLGAEWRRKENRKKTAR